MKRLYTYMLSAAIAAAASAAIPVSKAQVKGQMSDLQKTGRIISESVASRPAEKMTAAAPRKAASRSVTAPKSIEDLCNMQWEASYKGLLTSNSGTHSGAAKFVYYEEYDELDLTLPDYSNSFYVGFDEKTSSLLIYSGVGYGTASDGSTIKLEPVNPTNGAANNKNFTIPFNEATGSFEFPSTFAWALSAYSGSNCLAWYWMGSNFTLSVADGDYSIKAAIDGSEVSADNIWTINVEQGADVASVKCLVLPDDSDPDMYGQYIASLGDEVTNGSITVNPVVNNALGETITESGFACALFASYDAEGNLKNTAHVGLPVIIDDEQEGWATVGTVNYVDGVFAQYYQAFEYSKEVLVQAKTDNTPVYRFVTPYSDYSIYDLAGHTHSMVIDATHSDWVAIPCTFSGLDLGGDGVLAFGSFAALGYDYATAVSRGYAGGTIEDNVVTFPKGTILAHEQYYNEPGSWSYVNSPNSTETYPIVITLPAITLNIAAVNEDETPNAGVEIKLAGSDEVIATTDENGTATIEVPFTTGYFGEIALTIGDQDVTVTLNGAENEYTYKAGGEPVVGEWKSLGKGTWVDGFFTDWYVLFEGFNNTWEVEIEESTATPGIYRVLPYATDTEGAENLDDTDDDNYFVVNATDPDKVFVVGPFTPFGDYDLRQDCPESCEGYEGEGTYGKFVDGEIFFPASSFTEYYEDEAYDPTNSEGVLMIVLPGYEVKDYQLVTASSLCGENGKATINFETIGGGIASIQTTTVTGHQIFAENVKGEAVNVDLTGESVSHTVDNPVGGNTTLVKALDANGNVRRSKTVYHYNSYDFVGWHFLKEAKVTESCLYPAFGYEDEEVICNLEEKDDMPGMYRIANVYRDHDFTLGHLMHNHYLYIDATDPDYVKVIPSTTGIGEEGIGEIYITNDAEYLEQAGEKEFAKENGLCGTHKDNIIDLGNIRVAYTNYANGAWNEGFGTITIELLKEDGISEINSDNESDAVYYNIRGQRVSRPTVPGIYVRNNTKIYVK